jgi:hypothetical protein
MSRTEGFDRILSAPVPASTEDAARERIAAAVRDFTASRTNDDLRHAVRDLVDILELVRPEIKAHMLTQDERDLFTIANNFAIRHLNQSQRSDYASAPWLRWMFYVNLANGASGDPAPRSVPTGVGTDLRQGASLHPPSGVNRL